MRHCRLQASHRRTSPCPIFNQLASSRPPPPVVWSDELLNIVTVAEAEIFEQFGYAKQASLLDRAGNFGGPIPVARESRA